MNAKKKFFTKWRCYVVCKATMSTCNVDYELNKLTMYLVYSVSLIDNRVDNKHTKKQIVSKMYLSLILWSTRFFNSFLYTFECCLQQNVSRFVTVFTWLLVKRYAYNKNGVYLFYQETVVGRIHNRYQGCPGFWTIQIRIPRRCTF